MHAEIWKRLDYYLECNKIPNIIFYGEHGSGKKTIVRQFINKVYNHSKEKIKSQVMFVNCAIGKGIKFVREDLKFFAKTNTENGIAFKSIVFLNTDHLTIDAQSALRRCIELYSHNTRFFIVIEKINNLMNPIISRFCDVHVSKIDTVRTNESVIVPNECLHIIEKSKKDNIETLIQLTKTLYSGGYSALDILQCYSATNEELSFAFSKWRREFRNEMFLMLLLLNFLFLDRNLTFEHISFM